MPKALIGAAAVVLLAVLSKTRNYYIADLVPLLPTFVLTVYYIVGEGRSLDDPKATTVFGMWSIIPYFVYPAALYLLIERFRLETSLALAALAWLIMTSVLAGPRVRLHAWNRERSFRAGQRWPADRPSGEASLPPAATP